MCGSTGVAKFARLLASHQMHGGCGSFMVANCHSGIVMPSTWLVNSCDLRNWGHDSPQRPRSECRPADEVSWYFQVFYFSHEAEAASPGAERPE